MKRQGIIIALLVLLLVGNLFFLYYLYMYDSPLDNQYTYTKAVCNDSNECQDYTVACKNGSLISMEPIGKKVKFSPNWKDPRSEEQINATC